MAMQTHGHAVTMVPIVLLHTPESVSSMNNRFVQLGAEGAPIKAWVDILHTLKQVVCVKG